MDHAFDHANFCIYDTVMCVKVVEEGETSILLLLKGAYLSALLTKRMLYKGRLGLPKALIILTKGVEPPESPTTAPQ